MVGTERATRAHLAADLGAADATAGNSNSCAERWGDGALCSLAGGSDERTLADAYDNTHTHTTRTISLACWDGDNGIPPTSCCTRAQPRVLKGLATRPPGTKATGQRRCRARRFNARVASLARVTGNFTHARILRRYLYFHHSSWVWTWIDRSRGLGQVTPRMQGPKSFLGRRFSGCFHGADVQDPPAAEPPVAPPAWLSSSHSGSNHGWTTAHPLSEVHGRQESAIGLQARA